MSELRLTLALDDDGNGCGWLAVSMQADDFTARADSYVSTDQLFHFARALGNYPISPDTGIAFSTDIIGDEVKISIVPLNSRGHLKVSAELSHAGDQLPQTAKLSIVSDYAGLETFRRELERMLTGEQVEATLRAHR